MITKRNRTLPLLLIGVGLLILMVRVGPFSWVGVLGLLQLWPLVLIAVGADILLRGRYRLMTVLGTGLVAAGLYAGLDVFSRAPGARTETVAQTLEGAQRAEVRLETGVGNLGLRAPTRDPNMLIEGRAEAGRGERITQSFRREGETAVFELKSERGRGLLRLPSGNPRWDLTVTGSVPLELTLSTGVGRAELDLTGAQLSRLDLDTGVGSVSVTLPATGRYDARLDAGVGAATVRLPQEVAARITVDRGLGAVSVSGAYERTGNVYVSPDFDLADERVDLEVNGGVGAITVETF